jgi:hypothetical protein
LSRRINIDRLEIRLTGISPQSARAAVGDLGRDLQRQLALSPVPGGRKGAVRIGGIDSGTVQLSEGTSPAELRGAIAQRLTGSISAKLKTQVNKR